MNFRSRVALSVGMALAVGVFSQPAQAQVKSPTETYLAFVATNQKAKSLDELMPFLNKEYRTNLSGEPAEKKPVWLGRLKDTDKRDIKAIKETITGDKAVVETTAKSTKGEALKGMMFLVKEADGWKIEAQSWAEADAQSTVTGAPPVR